MESLTEEQRKEIEENESMILNSTSTIEAQAGAKGQEWTNLGRQLFAAAPGPKAEVWWDYSSWSPAPWTSGQAEPLPLMAFKAMMLGARTLQAGWNLQVSHRTAPSPGPGHTSHRPTRPTRPTRPNHTTIWVLTQLNKEQERDPLKNLNGF